MKSQKFFFSVVAVIVVLGVFFFFFFGIVKPRFQSAVEKVNDVQVAAVTVVGHVTADAVSVHGVDVVSDRVVVENPVVEHVVSQVNVVS